MARIAEEFERMLLMDILNVIKRPIELYRRLVAALAQSSP